MSSTMVLATGLEHVDVPHSGQYLGHLLTANGLTLLGNLAHMWWGHCALDMPWFPTSQAQPLSRMHLWTESDGLRTPRTVA